MQLRSTYGAWDFLDVWSLDEGNDYPVLRRQEGAPQSGFAVTGPAETVAAGTGFQLNITGAKGADGVLFNGASRQVTVYSDLQGANVVQSDIVFSGGGASVPVTLTTEGSHNLRVYVEGVSYSNLVAVEIGAPSPSTVVDPAHSSVELTSGSEVVAGYANITIKFTIANDQGTPISGEHWVNVGRTVAGDWVHTTYDFDSSGVIPRSQSGRAL